LPATVKGAQIPLPGAVVASDLPGHADGDFLAVLRPEQMQIATGAAPSGAAELKPHAAKPVFSG